MDRKKHEILSICILIVTLLVFFSLISFNQADQTYFNASVVKRSPNNWVGFLGANIAWVLLFMIGLGAYGLSFVGLWLSWSLLRGVSPLPKGWLQAAGSILLAMSALCLFSFHFPKIHFLNQEILPGGQLSYLLNRFLVSRIYSVGTHILLVGTLLIAFVLATPFTLRSLCVWGVKCAVFFGRAFRNGLLCGVRAVRTSRPSSGEERIQEGPLPALPVPVIEPERIRAVDVSPAQAAEGKLHRESGVASEVSETELDSGSEAKALSQMTSNHAVGTEGTDPPKEDPVQREAPRVLAPTIRRKPRKEPDPPAELQGDGFPAASGNGVGYELPSLDLLDTYETEHHRPNPRKLESNAKILEEKLSDFGVHGKVVAISPGPVITMYEYAPAPGIKISRIVGLSDDLSMALKAISIRVVAPIPGKAAIGIEIPNEQRVLVSARAVLESEAFSRASTALTIALGQDITGQPMVANLAKMPHLLIAGATGTGKSVCINAVLSSLLFRNTPDEMRLLLIDPKRIELSSYEGIPHLIHPVVTDAKLATRALRWAVQEMELRYRLLAEKNVRNIEGYNRVLEREESAAKAPDAAPAESEDGAQLQHHHLPYVVIIIDELADLMMVASREVEESITRLAQMARAAGIHLILATQRPSVDVLTGIIKANIPTRISFQVSSRIDSRTILDGSGAESLLGSGDMLFLPPGTAKIQRIHGAYISDAEVQQLTEFWKAQQLKTDPLKERVNFREESGSDDVAEDELDEKYEEAVELVLETRQASISMLQRRLRVGYNRAARMIEVMEQQGLVAASDGVKPREVIGRRD